MNAFVVGLFVLLALNLLFGIFVGMIRGVKKSVIRLITIGAAFALALIFTPMLTGIAANNASVENLVVEQISKTMSGGMDGFSAMVAEYYTDLAGLVGAAVNPILFLVVFLAFNFVALIVYFILALIFGRRKRDENGKKKKKGRLLGLIVGAVSGFVIFFAFFIPINGYLNVAATLASNETVLTDTLNEVSETELPGGLKLDIKGYSESSAIKALGLGLGDPCFDMLSTSKFRDTDVTLKKEITAVLEALKEFDNLAENPMDDLNALRGVVSAAFESQIFAGLADIVVEYGLEHPDLITGMLGAEETADAPIEESGYKILSYIADDVELIADEESSGVDLDNLFGDTEVIDILLNGLKGDIKGNILGVLDTMIFLKDELKIDFMDMDMETMAATATEVFEEGEYKDKYKSEVLIDKIFSIGVIRDMFVYVSPAVLDPLSDTIGSGVTFEKPNITDWENEKRSFNKIFNGYNAMMDLMNIEGGADEQVQQFENLLDGNSDILVGLMEGLRDSGILKPLYNGITKFVETDEEGEEVEEYWFIDKINSMVFSGEGQTNSSSVRGIFVGGQIIYGEDGKPELSEGGEVQYNDAIIDAEGNNNIDFSKFDWKLFFSDMNKVIKLVDNMKQLEAMKEINLESVENVAYLLRNLDSLPSDVVNDMIYSFIPKDSNITIPMFNENVSFTKEADIYEKLYKYQDNTEDGVAPTEEEVDEIVGSLMESEVILPMLDSSGVDLTEKVTGTTKSSIESKLEAMEAENENEEDEESKAETQAKIDQIKKMFGLGAIEEEPEETEEPETEEAA